MKQLIAVVFIIASIACTKKETTISTQADTPSGTTATTVTTASDKTYPMNGVIVSRDPAKKTVNIDNEDVPGVMAPMKMDYELRGATVDSLPPDGTKVQMTLHEENGNFWVTDVKPRQ